MQPYFTLCVGAAASGTVYDDMSLLPRVVIVMAHASAVRVGVFVGKPMLIIFLGAGVDSYEAFWPEGAWAMWYDVVVFNTHVYEITDEPRRPCEPLPVLLDSSSTYSLGGRGRRGLTRLLFIVWGGVA